MTMDKKTELRRKNYEEFIDTIPPEVKAMMNKIFDFFKKFPSPFSFMFADAAVFIYLEDEDFKTIVQIVDHVGGDLDSPPFKPYKNEDGDELFAAYNYYLKITADIIENSGYVEPAETNDEEKTAELPMDGSVAENFDDATNDAMEPVIDDEDEQIYWDQLKLIANDVDGEILELMRKLRLSTGVVIPLTVVRIGSKLIIRTNGDQPSFDEFFMTVKEKAAEIFTNATKVTGTKNNVQIVF